MWVRNIATMFGHRERDWWELWAQSHVPIGAKSISVDEAPQALFLLKNHAFAKNTGSLAMSQFDTVAMRSADALCVPFVAYL